MWFIFNGDGLSRDIQGSLFIDKFFYEVSEPGFLVKGYGVGGVVKVRGM